MIDLYFWPTPNCYKISILLEELNVPYTSRPIHIGKGEQYTPEFEAINPNGKVPALIDHDGPDGKSITIFESGAIMIYLAEKAGKFIPQPMAPRMAVLEWLMFQMGSVGPMLGQAHHFRKYAKTKIPYAVDRYTQEATRIYNVLDKRLGITPFLAGEYSIADMAVYPWLRPYRWQGQELSEFSNLQRWYSAMRERPAVQRGVAVMGEQLKRNRDKPIGEAWDILFGSRQSYDEKQNKLLSDKGSRP